MAFYERCCVCRQRFRLTPDIICLRNLVSGAFAGFACSDGCADVYEERLLAK